jgi:hypothetical protein
MRCYRVNRRLLLLARFHLDKGNDFSSFGNQINYPQRTFLAQRQNAPTRYQQINPGNNLSTNTPLVCLNFFDL